MGVWVGGDVYSNIYSFLLKKSYYAHQSNVFENLVCFSFNF